MKLGLGAIHELDDERLVFAKQLGVDNIIVHSPELPGDGCWDFRALLNMRTYVESYGLTLYAIENMQTHFYDKILWNEPGRDEQVEKVQQLVRNMGRAGIRVLGYHWIALGVWRTSHAPTGRGGARVTAYDHALAANAPLDPRGPIDDDTLWASLEYFLKAVVPVAEEEGVRLSLHPDDPPISPIAGTARIIRSTEAYKRVIEMVPSDSNCLEFCQGTVSEWCQTADDVYDAIRYFTTRKKITYVHFRNVRGVMPSFTETFIDNGKVDMLEAMRAYNESDYDGVLIVDHTPGVIGDTRWGHRGRAYGIGYIKALMKCVTAGA